MPRSRSLISISVSLVLIASACGGDDESSGTTAPAVTSAPTGAPTSAPSTSAGGSGGSPTSAAGDPESGPPTPAGYAEIFADRGPADSSKPTIKVGFYNMDSGVPSFPDASVAFKVAVDYINAHLGGVNGHPLDVVSCSAAMDPASNLECAQKFTNDKAVNVVGVGVAIGTSNALPVFEQVGLPLVEAVPTSPLDYASPVVVSYFGGTLTTSLAAVRYATDELGADALTLVTSEGAAGVATKDLVDAGAAAAGATARTAFIPESSADASGLLLSAGVQETDAIVVMAPPAICIATTRALQQLKIDKPVIASPSCHDASVVAAGIDGWYLSQPGPSPEIGDGEDAAVDLLRAAYREFNGGKQLTEGVATASFGTALSIWMVGNEMALDAVPTRDQWLAGLKAFKGPVPMGARTAACTVEAMPALCVQEAWIYRVVDGRLTEYVAVVDGSMPQG